MVRFGHFELSLVKPSGEAFPEVVHNGKAYAVAAPGQPYEVKVTQLNTAAATYGRPSFARSVVLTVDGQAIGYSKYLESTLSTQFDGFLKAGDATSIAKQGFVFAKPEESEEKARRVTNLDFQEGKIVAKVRLVEFTGTTQAVLRQVGSVSSAASVAKLPEGKKFFMAPSLTTGKGELKVGYGFDQRSFRYVNGDVAEAVLELRYETAATLLLRGVLKQDNPQHAAILQAAGEAAPEEDAGNDENAAGSSRAAAAAAAAGRQRKRQRQQAQQQQQQQPELIDLTNAVNEGDEVLAAKRQNKVLQCDLTGEEEPAWRAVKKEVVDV